MTRRNAMMAVLFASTLACARSSEHVEPSAFVEAVKNQSTSPSYVKVRINDVQTAKTFDTCVTANLFMGAVHIERRLPDTQKGIDVGERFVISRENQVFSFRSPQALANMPWHPSKSELASAAHLLASTNDSSLRSSLENGELRKFYFGQPRERERMAALACALIDRGYRPGVEDRSGYLFIER